MKYRIQQGMVIMTTPIIFERTDLLLLSNCIAV